jgi:hypothetical protein
MLVFLDIIIADYRGRMNQILLYNKFCPNRLSPLARRRSALRERELERDREREKDRETETESYTKKETDLTPSGKNVLNRITFLSI